MLEDIEVIKVEQVGGGLPDIDIDVAQSDRKKVISYLRKRFKQVFHIANFSYMKPRAAFKAAARAVELPFGIANLISKEIYSTEEIPSFEELKKNSDIFSKIDEKYIPLIKEALNLSKYFLGRVDHVGVHAAGIAIGSKELPIMVAEGTPLLITQYDMYALEKLGVLKQDILGLRTLDVIKNTIKLIGKDISFDYKDSNVFDFISSGDLYGVFQLERKKTQEVCHKAKIRNMFDLASVLAVIRPGSADAKVGDKTFLDIFLEGGIKHDIEPLNRILGKTKGVLLFQEQQMEICKELAGFTLAEADDIRKAIGKKNKDILNKYEKRFIEGMVSKGYSIQKAEELWQWFTVAAYYSFNLSHAISYSFITYQTAYLKYYYPLEYMTSLLNSFVKNKEKRVECISKIKEMGIKILPPRIDDIHYEAKIKDGAIILGFGFIEGVGKSQYNSLVENSPYKSIDGFINKEPCSRNVIINIAKSGALDSIEKNRVFIVNKIKNKSTSNLFEGVEKKDEITDMDIAVFEEEAFGISITKGLEDALGLSLMPNSIDKVDINNEEFVAILSSIRYGTTKNGDPYTALMLRGKKRVLPKVFYWGNKFYVKKLPSLVRVRGREKKDYFQISEIETINT